jgi:hypothetical protein
MEETQIQRYVEQHPFLDDMASRHCVSPECAEARDHPNAA